MTSISGKKFRLVSLVAVAAIALTTFGASASAASTITQSDGSIITSEGAGFIPEPLHEERQDGQKLWEKYLASQKKTTNGIVLASTSASAVAILSASEKLQLREYVSSDEFLDGIHKLSKEDLKSLKELLRSK